MNKLLELDAEKIKKMIYGKSAEIADKVGMRKRLLSKKVNVHTIITLEEINRIATALEVDTLEILKQTYPDLTDYPQNFQNGLFWFLVRENSSSNICFSSVILIIMVSFRLRVSLSSISNRSHLLRK